MSKIKDASRVWNLIEEIHQQLAVLRANQGGNHGDSESIRRAAISSIDKSTRSIEAALRDVVPFPIK